MLKKIAQLSLRFPKTLISITLLITLFFAYQIQYVEFETDLESLFITERASEKYDNYMLLLEAENPYEAEKLQLVYEVIQELEALDIFSASVNPFTFTTFEKTGTRIRPAIPAPKGRAPETPEEIEVFKERLLNDPFAKGKVVSPDGNIFSIYLPQTRQVNEAAEYNQIIEDIIRPLDQYFTLYRIGSIPYTLQTTKHLTHDLSLLLSLALLFMVVFFFFGFKSGRSVVLPLIVVLSGLIWSTGAMAMLNYPISLLTVSLPPVILALGSSYTIHMLNQYVRDAVGLSEEQHRELHPYWMLEGLSKIGKTILVAGLTTLVGFISLLFSQIEQIRHFGIGAIVGIGASIMLSLFFLPAALSLFPRPRKVTGELVMAGYLTKGMAGIGPHVIRHYKIYMLLTFVLFVGMLFSYPQIEQKTDYLQYYPKDDPVIRDIRFLIQQVGSSQDMYVRLTAPEDAPKDGDSYFYDTDVLKKIMAFEGQILSFSTVDYAASFPGYVSFINEIMSGESGIPDTRGLVLLVSRIFSLAEQSGYELVGSYVSDDGDELRLSFNIFDDETKLMLYDEDMKELLADVRATAEEMLPAGMGISLEGWSLEFTRLTDILKQDQRNSTLLAVGGVLLIAVISFLSLDFGLLTLIPLGFGLFVTYISMAVFKIPMDIASAMMSSIAIGVGVDDAIHFLIHYRRSRGRLNIRDSILDTIMVTGRPIVLTTLGIVGGMIILVFASFRPIVSFGLLISLALGGACLGTIIILPSWIYGLSRLHKSRTVE